MIFGPLTCLVMFSFAMANQNSTQSTTMPIPSNSAVPATVILNFTERKRHKTSTKLDNGGLTSTEATTERTGQTSQSETETTSLKTSTPRSQTPTFTSLTTQAIHSITGYLSTPNPSVFQTENSSQIGKITMNAGSRTTQGLQLNISEKNMTIIFGFVLGVFAVALVIIMFDKCKHKIQFVHRPLNSADDPAGFVAGDVSGGLYDDHPIFDNVPPTPVDQSQFRLELFQ